MISSISPSTITIESLEAPTIMSSSTPLCKVSQLGLMLRTPSFLITLTSEKGPLKGISVIATAAEAASPAKESGITFPS